MHQQSARRAPSFATLLQPAKVAAILQVSPKAISCAAAIEQLAASPTREVRAA
jgi:hypothetical protein